MSRDNGHFSVGGRSVCPPFYHGMAWHGMTLTWPYDERLDVLERCEWSRKSRARVGSTLVVRRKEGMYENIPITYGKYCLVWITDRRVLSDTEEIFFFPNDRHSAFRPVQPSSHGCGCCRRCCHRAGSALVMVARHRGGGRGTMLYSTYYG